jgi:hypothetical protein
LERTVGTFVALNGEVRRGDEVDGGGAAAGSDAAADVDGAAAASSSRISPPRASTVRGGGGIGATPGRRPDIERPDGRGASSALIDARRRVGRNICDRR